MAFDKKEDAQRALSMCRANLFMIGSLPHPLAVELAWTEVHHPRCLVSPCPGSSEALAMLLSQRTIFGRLVYAMPVAGPPRLSHTGASPSLSDSRRAPQDSDEGFTEAVKLASQKGRVPKPAPPVGLPSHFAQTGTAEYALVSLFPALNLHTVHISV